VEVVQSLPLVPLQWTMENQRPFKIIPDSGYKITNVKVDGVSVGAVSTYTFSNVTSDHKIEATFEKK